MRNDVSIFDGQISKKLSLLDQIWLLILLCDVANEGQFAQNCAIL